MPSNLPLSDADLARLHLESILTVAREERPVAEARQPLPADPKAAFVELKRIEEEEARPFRGQLDELARMLRTEQPDIIGEINQIAEPKGLWQRVLLTLGLD